MSQSQAEGSGVGTLVKSLSVLIVILVLATIYLVFFASHITITLEPTDPVEGEYVVYEYDSLTEHTQEVVDYGISAEEGTTLSEDHTNIDLDYEYAGVITDDGELHTFVIEQDTSRSTALTVLILMGFFLVLANLAAIIFV